MNSIKTANILLIVVLVVIVGSTVAQMLTKKTLTTNQSGDLEEKTEFVGFGGKKASKKAA